MKTFSPNRSTRALNAGNGLQKDSRHQAAGFSLVEIMVGMVIGMLGIIVMMQIFALFEGQKRTTSGGGEAQNTGAIALSGLSDEIRQSGYGFTLLNVIGCDVLLPSGVTVTEVAPVSINSASVPAGDANTDTLLVASGTTDLLPEGTAIRTPAIDATHFSVQSWASFTVGDYVIATPSTRLCAPGNPAVLNQVTAVTNPTLTLAHGAPGIAPPGMMFSLGPTVNLHAYAVRNGNLTVCDYMANNCGDATKTLDTTVWVLIAGNIVSLRAQYGQDITNNTPSVTSPNTGVMDGIVDIYSQTSPANTGLTKDACGWLRTLSVRLALVARNTQYEKTAVTTNVPIWAGSTAANNDPSWLGTTAGASANPIDLTKNPDGTTPTQLSDLTYPWEHYRYKVFQTTLPIRNITSSVILGVTSGC